ncbi:MAG TPA: hypothetical protein VGU01_08290 [Sphingomicrobium sp.]|nr:hypothetical protein [Sphingomicrobium sp.]
MTIAHKFASIADPSQLRDRKADLHLETLWSANITITTRLVGTVSTPDAPGTP